MFWYQSGCREVPPHSSARLPIGCMEGARGGMPSRDLGAVVVGTGFGVLTHLRALRGAGINVKALVARNPEKTAARAAKVGVERGLTSLHEALALPGVDIVSVATPPHSHAAIVLDAIAAGKHVLCEKPFARDAGEARRMLEAAEAAGIVHMLGTEFRYSTAQAHATRAAVSYTHLTLPTIVRECRSRGSPYH